jgi:hypothetical protein
MWYEVVMADFKALFENLPGMSGKYGTRVLPLLSVHPRILLYFLQLLFLLLAYLLAQSNVDLSPG